MFCRRSDVRLLHSDASSPGIWSPNNYVLNVVDGNLVYGTTLAPLVRDVPELSTWAMMILSFAGVAFMAYRHNSRPLLMAA